MRWLGVVTLVLLAACGAGRTEVAVALRSSRPITLATLELHVTVDETAPSPVIALRERAADPRLPGSILLEVPGNASTVTVLAVGLTPGGARRTAQDTVRVRRGARVALELRLEFGDGGPIDGLPLGAACAVPADCSAGFCVDGTCCDRACDEGECVACTVAAGAASDGVCGPRRARAVCRDAAGTCDVAEVCDGEGAACPPDDRANPGSMCRASIGACDLPEACEGTAVDCPVDRSLCQPTEYCDGSSCVPKKPNGGGCAQDVQCSTGFCANGACCNARCDDGPCQRCDLAGKIGTCSLLDPSTVCAPRNGACDVDDHCTGTSGACPATYLAAFSTCRPARDTCDQSEYCTGASPACPALDRVMPADMLCRGAASPCDSAERCDGVSPLCPVDTRAVTSQLAFYAMPGNDGTINGAGDIDTTRVVAGCDGFTFARQIGLVSWDTANTLPVGAVVDAAVIRACLDGGSGTGSGNLWSATFSIPLSNAGNTGSFLAAVPNVTGPTDISIPPAGVKPNARTQLQFLPSQCVGAQTFERRAAGAGSPAGSYPTCTTGPFGTLGWRLNVSYCVP